MVGGAALHKSVIAILQHRLLEKLFGHHMVLLIKRLIIVFE